MTYVASEARQRLLDTIAEATDELGEALASLGDAYEQLDERSADRLEEQLFKPVQAAYGRARRTHAEFAERHGLPGRTFTPAAKGAASRGVKGFLELVCEAVQEAELILSELQDSMLPVEVGDPQLRSGLAEIRSSIAEVSGRVDRFVSLFGR